MMVTCSPRAAKRLATSDSGTRWPGARKGMKNISRGREDEQSMVCSSVKCP